MADPSRSDQLNLFDESIRRRFAHMESRKRCLWCVSSDHQIKAKGLCASCYRWNLKLTRLTAEFDQLPSGAHCDASFSLRHKLDVARCAVRLCKMDGKLIESASDSMSAIDLEQRFSQLCRTILDKKAASRLFQHQAAFLNDFSPFQRAWIGYLLTTMLHELHRRDRRGKASRLNLREKNNDAERT